MGEMLELSDIGVCVEVHMYRTYIRWSCRSMPRYSREVAFVMGAIKYYFTTEAAKT